MKYKQAPYKSQWIFSRATLAFLLDSLNESLQNFKININLINSIFKDI